MKVSEIEELFYKPLHEIGKIADSMNEFVTFAVNKHINYTDVCVAKCPICAFSNRKMYVMSTEDVLKEAIEAEKLGATEVHVVGGLNPDLGVEYFEDMFRKIKEKTNLTIKALTAAEVFFYSKKDGISVREFLSRLKDSGISMLTGGGAEILVNNIRKKICPKKCRSEDWLKVMKIAHEIGLKSNATMLFGHVEKIRHRAQHLYKLKKLHEKTKGFIAFVPLPFISAEEKLNVEDVLKTIAVSRIVLNFKGIKAYWPMLGESLATVALRYGANDLDGTVMGEKIAHAAGANTPDGLEFNRILRMAKASGKRVALRDSMHNVVRWLW